MIGRKEGSERARGGLPRGSTSAHAAPASPAGRRGGGGSLGRRRLHRLASLPAPTARAVVPRALRGTFRSSPSGDLPTGCPLCREGRSLVGPAGDDGDLGAGGASRPAASGGSPGGTAPLPCGRGTP